jgi:hypothetical protein
MQRDQITAASAESIVDADFVGGRGASPASDTMVADARMTEEIIAVARTSWINL